MSNTDQAEFWSGQAGRTWVAQQHAMDALLAPVLQNLLTAAELTPGARVLDIGTGAGASTLTAAQQVGADGHVLGADISPTLLALARKRLADVPQADVVEADAATASLPGPFDAMISRFGVMFFEDTPAAFRNIASALKPGAQITFAAWADVGQNPYFTVPAAAARSVLGDVPRTDRSLPGPFAFEDAERVTRDLLAAGLRDITIDTRTMLLTPSGSLSDLADLCMVIGPAASASDKLGATDDQRTAIRDEIAAKMEMFESADGIKVPACIHIVTART